MIIVPEVQPVMIPDMDTEQSIVVENRLRFIVDDGACHED